MKLIMFSKMLKELSVPQLIATAHDWNLDGIDLCVRPGYPVEPANATTALPQAVKDFRAEGLDIPMVTANADLLTPENPDAAMLLDAMDRADVRLLKLGYFNFKPWEMNYQVEMARIKAILKSWLPLARKHNVKICYHTHCNKCMALNASGLAHLLEDLDPQYFGAYLDPGHLRVEGEDFPTAVGMVRPWLSLVALKDVLIERVEAPNGLHGTTRNNWCLAGQGMVDWQSVFDTLKKANYDGPCTVHCEFKSFHPDNFLADAKREAAFFRHFVN